MSRKDKHRSRTRLRRRTRRWLWAASIVLVVGATVGYLAWNYGWEGVVGVGEAAPPFVLEDGEGRAVDLADYFGRKPVVLVFYMTHG